MSSNLPQLPEYALQFRPRWPGDEGGFTEAQLRAYGKACAAAERADAERYRWLRDVGDTTWRPFGLRAGYSAATADAVLVAAAPSLAQRLAELVTRYSMDGVPNDSVPAFDAALQLLRELGHPLPTWLRA